MNLSSAILQLKVIGIPSLNDIDWIDPPKPDAVKSAMQELKDLGAVDTEGKVTTIGKYMSLLPVEPAYAHLILTPVLQREFRPVLSEIVAIVAMISSQHVFYSRNVSSHRKHSSVEPQGQGCEEDNREQDERPPDAAERLRAGGKAAVQGLSGVYEHAGHQERP